MKRARCFPHQRYNLGLGGRFKVPHYRIDDKQGRSSCHKCASMEQALAAHVFHFKIKGKILATCTVSDETACKNEDCNKMISKMRKCSTQKS